MSPETTQHLADLIRVANIPLAAITCGISLAIVIGNQTRSRSQRWRFMALIALCAGLALGNYSNLGNRPSNWWGFGLVSLGIWMSAAGCMPLLLGNKRSASLIDEATQEPILGDRRDHLA